VRNFALLMRLFLLVLTSCLVASCTAFHVPAAVRAPTTAWTRRAARGTPILQVSDPEPESDQMAYADAQEPLGPFYIVGLCTAGMVTIALTYFNLAAAGGESLRL
jgi:hypothetical protein